MTGRNGINTVTVQAEPDRDGNYPRALDFLAVDMENLVEGHVCPVQISVTDSEGLTLVATATGGVASYQYGIDGAGVLGTREVYEDYFRLGAQAGRSVNLFDYRLLRDHFGATSNTKNQLKDVKEVSFGFSTDYNLGQMLVINKVYTVSLGDYYLEKNSSAILNADGFVIGGNQFLAQAEKDTVCDLTAEKSGIEPEEVSALRFSPVTYKKGLTLGLKGAGKTPYLAAPLDGALKFSLTPDGTVTSSDTTSPYYSADLFAYADIWKAEAGGGVAVHDGVAVKLMNVYAGLALRLVFTDEDGEIFFTASANDRSYKRVYPCIAEDLTDIGCDAYWHCIWPSRTAGTLYFPYSDLIQGDGINNQNLPVNGDKKLTKIVKVQLAFDTASAYALNASAAIGTLADVDMVNEEIYEIFDTAKFTDAQVREVKPCSEEFKNANWNIVRIAHSETIGRSKMTKTHEGDVKILEDFSVPANLSKEDAKSLVQNLFHIDGQKSYPDFIANEKEGLGYSLSLTVGDFMSEFRPIGNDWTSAVLLGAGTTLAKNWSDLTGALGFSVYVKNTQDHIVDFNFEFSQTQENGTYERWGLNTADARVYAYDVNTGKERALAAMYGIYVPANFEGYMRIPFAVFSNPAWNYEGDGIFDETCAMTGVYLSIFMERNSGVTLVIDEIGLYYEEFTLGGFRGGKSIHECMQSDRFGGAR